MALATDGSSTSTGTTATSIAGSITTSNTNDIIVAAVRVTDGNPANSPTTTGVSGGSLTWTKALAVTYKNTVFAEISIWYAVAASTLSAVSMTASFNQAPTASRISLMGVSGANTSTPLDTNGSIPGSNSSNVNVSSLANASAITTNNANTMLIGFLGGEGISLGTVTRPSGFTQVTTTGAVQDLSSLVVSSVQTSQTYTWSWTGGAQECGVIIIAVQASGGAPTPKLYRATNLDGLSAGGPFFSNPLAA